jgi:hypothetical protein
VLLDPVAELTALLSLALKLACTWGDIDNCRLADCKHACSVAHSLSAALHGLAQVDC